jgi:hypothetical protein
MRLLKCIFKIFLAGTNWGYKGFSLDSTSSVIIPLAVNSGCLVPYLIDLKKNTLKYIPLI